MTTSNQVYYAGRRGTIPDKNSRPAEKHGPPKPPNKRKNDPKFWSGL